MTHKRRTVLGRARRQKPRKSAASRSRNRLRQIERLEDRVLLAADLNPWHNYAFPLDVTGNYRVTPLDALTVINALKNGPIDLNGLLHSQMSEAENEAGSVVDAALMSHLKLDVNNDRVVSAQDVLTIINALNAEGEDLAKLVKAEARITQNIPADGFTPMDRPIVSLGDVVGQVNVGETVLLNAHVEDIRTNDGIPDPTSDEFGVFAAYFSVAWDPDAFHVPQGVGDNPIRDFGWPISFLNPEHFQRFPGPPRAISTDEYNFPNGPAGEINREIGFISEAGGFTNRSQPIGRDLPQVSPDDRHVFLNLHLFDVPFETQSLYAKDDQFTVDAGSSVQFLVNDLLDNDGLIVGNYDFTIGGVDGVGREVLTFGDNQTAAGGQGGSVVPPANILFVNSTVNVPLNGRELTFAGHTQPSLGTLISGANGAFTYTPNPGVTGPATDTFSYTVSDGQGRTRTADVTIEIVSVNAPPVIAAPGNVTMDERKDGDPAFAFTGANSVSITDADGDPMRVTLATNAPIVVAAGSGVTFIDGDGSDGTLVFSGSQAQINTALAGLTYTPPAHFYGTPTLQVTAQDLDNSTVLSTVNHTVTINVQPINDPPTLEIPGNQTVITEDLPLVITGIEVGDPLDAQYAPGGDVEGRLTLATTGGSLNVLNPGGLTISGNGGDNVVMTGMTAAINNAMAAGVSFTGPVGTHSITATMNDLGNVDHRQPQEDFALQVQKSFQVTVVPPTRPFAVNDTFSVREDSENNVFQVLLNDFNFANQIGGANLEITAVSTPSNGAVVITNDATTLTYTPNPDFFGTDTFTYTIVDQTEPDEPKTESTATVTVNVTLVNDQPSFEVAEELIELEVNEDAGPQTFTNWATFDAGTPLENTVQSVLEYRVEVLTNANLFSQLPAVANNGTLTFTSADDAFGVSTFRVQVQDDGGTADGGIDTSDWQEFTIIVHPVNDPPTFSASDPPEVLEDSGPQVVPNWAHSFVPGPPNESDQELKEYEVTAVSNPALFEVQPSVDLNGTLTYTPADDAFGTSTFTVVARDDGGTERGGDDTSAPQTFTITVLAVNDPPSFEVAQTEITVRENEGLQELEGWVTEFTPGPPNESNQQVLQYIVNGITNPNLFEVPPSVSNDGTLRFQSAMNVGGTSQFTVVVQDDGGTERGGSDTSAPKTITINVTAVNDPPVNRLNGSPIEAGDQVFTANDFDLAFTAANSARLTVTDPDIADNDNTFDTFTVNLSVTNGLLLLGADDDATATKQLSALTLAEVNLALGTLIFRPDAGFIGEAALTITTNDGGTFGDPPDDQPLETTNTLTISVAPMNRPPIARDVQIEMPEGGVEEFNALANDSAGPNEDAFQTIRVISVDTTGTQGTVELLNAETGAFRFTPPDPHFNGQTTFSYTIQDDGQSMIDGQIVDDFKTDSAVVTITIWEVNDPPVAEDDLVLIDPQPAVGQQFRFHVSELLSNDRPGPPNESDQTLTIINVSTSAKGATVVLDGDEIVYTVPAGFDHVDTFEYTVQDDGTTRGQPDPKTDTATVTVRDVVLSSVAGYVYIDLDENGQKNAGEPGIAGVRIQLSGTDLTGNSFVEETVTDGDGRYEFSGVFPSQDGTMYTISQPEQPAGMRDGSASPGDGGVVSNPNEIRVQVPLIGFGSDPNNSITDNNNFGERGLLAEFTSINPYRSLLWSEINGNNPLLASGWLFATNAAGDLQWYINIGGWQHYVPGQSVDADSHHYQVQINNGSMWVTDQNADVERWLSVDLSSGRMKQLSANGSTIHHIIGSADLFDLPSYDPPTTNGGNGGGSGGLFSGEGEADQYAQAVDALFAAYE
ncbi:MAG: tandem-95 repeat protein [Planctomycetaceae bacterium]|nr:MAG: tandem-95 repeat protein [Planctomycetaceae bacterium]